MYKFVFSYLSPCFPLKRQVLFVYLVSLFCLVYFFIWVLFYYFFFCFLQGRSYPKMKCTQICLKVWWRVTSRLYYEYYRLVCIYTARTLFCPKMLCRSIMAFTFSLAKGYDPLHSSSPLALVDGFS